MVKLLDPLGTTLTQEADNIQEIHLHLFAMTILSNSAQNVSTVR